MYVFYAILGIVFLYLDLIKTNKVKLTLASTFLFCAIVAFKFPQNYLYQVFSFFAFSMLFYSLIARSLKKESEDIKKIKALDDYIGKFAVVTKDIGKTLSIDGFGMIRYKNEIYSAKSVDDKEIKAGSRVRIVSRENKVMNVEAVKNAKQ